MKLNLTPEVKPVILGGTGVSEVKAVNTKEVKPMLIWEVIKGSSQLSHSEITFIRKILCDELEEAEDCITRYKLSIRYWWNKSDPDIVQNSKGHSPFHMLNTCKDSLKRAKKRKKTIESSLYKLKKMMKDVV